jgi:Ca2+-binding EF-hand superfamily protein
VTEKAVIVTDNKTKKTMQIPYAVCVWSTGITQTSLVQKMVKQIPVQSHARALVTDGYLRVKGLTNVFAIGDCATIELPLLRSRLTDLYWKYDVDSDGTISRDEFRQMFDEIVDQYPQLQVYGRKAEGLFEEYDVNSDGQLSLGEFEELLKKADNNITTLPAVRV